MKGWRLLLPVSLSLVLYFLNGFSNASRSPLS